MQRRICGGLVTAHAVVSEMPEPCTGPKVGDMQLCTADLIGYLEAKLGEDVRHVLAALPKRQIVNVQQAGAPECLQLKLQSCRIVPAPLLEHRLQAERGGTSHLNLYTSELAISRCGVGHSESAIAPHAAASGPALLPKLLRRLQGLTLSCMESSVQSF